MAGESDTDRVRQSEIEWRNRHEEWNKKRKPAEGDEFKLVVKEH